MLSGPFPGKFILSPGHCYRKWSTEVANVGWVGRFQCTPLTNGFLVSLVSGFWQTQCFIPTKGTLTLTNLGGGCGDEFFFLEWKWTLQNSLRFVRWRFPHTVAEIVEQSPSERIYTSTNERKCTFFGGAVPNETLIFFNHGPHKGRCTDG